MDTYATPGCDQQTVECWFACCCSSAVSLAALPGQRVVSRLTCSSWYCTCIDGVCLRAVAHDKDPLSVANVCRSCAAMHMQGCRPYGSFHQGVRSTVQHLLSRCCQGVYCLVAYTIFCGAINGVRPSVMLAASVRVHCWFGRCKL